VRTLVTGAAGFIGSNLVAGLLTEGYDVVGVDDLSAGSKANLASDADFEFVNGDVRDPDVVTRAARGCDAILHQAAIRSVPASVKDPRGTTETNVGGTLSVLMAAHEVGARVVSASSSSVYGDQSVYPVAEDVELLPRSPYAASKRAAEIYCASWWRGNGVPTISLRYFNVYGPRQDPASRYAAVIPLFILACMDGTSPTIHGDGEQSRDFTFIDDVVQGNMLAMKAPEEAFGRAFNIGGGAEPTTVNGLLEMIGELTGSTPVPEHTPDRDGDIRRSQADISNAREVLGYRPTTSMKVGLERTVDWFKDRR
jgi:UDP-glucose 4-epimerase